MKRKTLLLFFFLIIVYAINTYATDINTCQTISSPGTYNLIGNMVQHDTNDCFIIISDNVTLDGHGFSVEKTSIDHGNGYSVILATGVNNLTIKDITLKLTCMGEVIELTDVNSSIVENSLIYTSFGGTCRDGTPNTIAINSTEVNDSNFLNNTIYQRWGWVAYPYASLTFNSSNRNIISGNIINDSGNNLNENLSLIYGSNNNVIQDNNFNASTNPSYCLAGTDSNGPSNILIVASNTNLFVNNTLNAAGIPVNFQGGSADNHFSNFLISLNVYPCNSGILHQYWMRNNTDNNSNYFSNLTLKTLYGKINFVNDINSISKGSIQVSDPADIGYNHIRFTDYFNDLNSFEIFPAHINMREFIPPFFTNPAPYNNYSQCLLSDCNNFKVVSDSNFTFDVITFQNKIYTIGEQTDCYEINTCGEITSPGEYCLTQDINTYVERAVCITINSSNVDFNGQGHSIFSDGNNAIHINSPDVNIRNVDLNYSGAFINANNVDFYDVNTGNGIDILTGSNDLNFVNTIFYQNTFFYDDCLDFDCEANPDLNIFFSMQNTTIMEWDELDPDVNATIKIIFPQKIIVNANSNISGLVSMADLGEEYGWAVMFPFDYESVGAFSSFFNKDINIFFYDGNLGNAPVTPFKFTPEGDFSKCNTPDCNYFKDLGGNDYKFDVKYKSIPWGYYLGSVYTEIGYVSLDGIYSGETGAVYNPGTTQTIEFFVASNEFTDGVAGVYYSNSPSEFQHHIVDLNLLNEGGFAEQGYCDGSFALGITCSYPWDVPFDLTGPIYFDINIFSSGLSDSNSSGVFLNAVDTTPPTMDYNVKLMETGIVGSFAVQTNLTCYDEASTTLDYNVKLNDVNQLSENDANGTLKTNDFNLTFGANTFNFTCTDAAGNYITANAPTIYAAIFRLINEQTGEYPVDLNAAGVTKAFLFTYDKNYTIDFNILAPSEQNFMDFNSILRFEFTYNDLAETQVQREIDIRLIPDLNFGVCVAPYQQFYEQLITSRQEKNFLLYNEFAKCYNMATSTKFAYQYGLMARGITIYKPYYLYLISNGVKSLLAKLEGSISVTTDLDSLEFNKDDFNVSVYEETVSFEPLLNTITNKYDTNTLLIYYLNPLNESTSTKFEIYNADGNSLWSYTENDTPNQILINWYYYYYSLDNNEMLSLKVTKTVDGIQSSKNYYFTIYGATIKNVFNPLFAIVIVFMLILFAITFVAYKYAFGWLGLLIAIIGIIVLSLVPGFWYVRVAQAILLIAGLFIALIFRYETGGVN